MERDEKGDLVMCNHRCVVQFPEKAFAKYTAEGYVKTQQVWYALDDSGTFLFKFAFCFFLLPPEVTEDVPSQSESKSQLISASIRLGRDPSDISALHVIPINSADGECPVWKQRIFNSLVRRNVIQTHNYEALFAEREALLKKLSRKQHGRRLTVDTIEETEAVLEKSIVQTMEDYVQSSEVLLDHFNKAEEMYFESFDHRKSLYRLYRGKSRKKTRKFCIIFAGCPFVKNVANEIFAMDLSRKYGVNVYVHYPRGIFEGGCYENIRHPNVLWKDVRSLVRMVKWHNQGMKVIVGGLNLGGTLFCNYLQWKKREPVDGLFLLSPFSKDTLTPYEEDTIAASHLVINAILKMKMYRLFGKWLG